MSQASRQTIIDFIVSRLKTGEQRGEILVKAGKKWGTSKSAFDRMLKIAKEIHSAQQETINKELAAIDKEAAINARKLDIMQADERKVILTKIARGQLKLTKFFVGKDYDIKKTVVPDWMDRKNAIAELNKMDGDYAPAKVANTDKDGNDVVPAQKLTDSQFDKMLKKINEASSG